MSIFIYSNLGVINCSWWVWKIQDHHQKHTKYPKQKRKANKIYNEILQELLSHQWPQNIMLIFNFKLSDTLEVSAAGMRNDLPMSLPLTKPSHSRNHCMLIQYITTGDSSSWNALLSYTKNRKDGEREKTHEETDTITWVFLHKISSYSLQPNNNSINWDRTSVLNPRKKTRLKVGGNLRCSW